MKQVFLKPGREKSLIRWHPWIFTGAIGRVPGSPVMGETVSVLTSAGKICGYGAWSPHSQIAVRMWTFLDEPVNTSFFRKKIEKALALRKSPVLPAGTTGIRLIHSESDGLPGITVDQYGDYLVCQISSAGAEYWKETLVQLLTELVPCKGIYERSDLAVRKKEGLPEKQGTLWGEVPPENVVINENGRAYQVNIATGHKTGFYLDQRDNRNHLSRYVDGREVLDCFSYTGGFAVAALHGGAKHVTLLDSSGPALAKARENIELNGFSPDLVDYMEADVFNTLRQLGANNRLFDLIILDPPKLIESQNQLEKGARAYKDVNRKAIQLLRPGGVLFTFSCSGHMEDSLFQKIVADAALDADREIQYVQWLAQATDHPVKASFPEGKYLKGLVAVV